MTSLTRRQPQSQSPSPIPTTTLLTPHLPPKTLVGIDLITFTSTPNFHGIRDIPGGWHFLYTGTTEGLSLRCGAWFYIDESETPQKESSASGGNGPQVLIWRWNGDTEALEPIRGTGEGYQEAMRYRANLGALWRGGGLFGYRSRVPAQGLRQAEQEEDEQEGRRKWKALTNRLSARLLSRITGAQREEGIVDLEMDWDGRVQWVVTSGGTARRDDDDIPGLDRSSLEAVAQSGSAGGREREFSFLPVDLKMTWREGAIGRERTEAARDRSWALGEIIHRISVHPDAAGMDDTEGEGQVLGELQFTFLMGLTLMNYSCLQQWKRLLRLILTCRLAIVERASFMVEVLRLLLLQLKRCDDIEGGLFDQLGAEERAGEGAEFLRKLLNGFRTALYETLEDVEGSPVKTEFERLEEWVKSEYDWELNRDAILRKGMLQLEDGEEVEMEMIEDEEDDYAPVIVDLDTVPEELR
ncbi:A1 cistron-splicing factor [Aspergillus pseudoustus]|uniref:A1 cistron-splicing factor n=1 Tax=Aspergillus pseudoustus TaxID=1810923 RepID=A0ABR4KWF4_9EURO